MAEDLHALEASTIVHLDRGLPAAALDRAIRQAVRDCLDRPGDKRARKVTLQLTIAPICQTDENVLTCEGATGAAQIRVKLPDYESQALDFGVRQGGQLVFSEYSPKNHRQGSLFEPGDQEAGD